jgi:hypothetical protein
MKRLFRPSATALSLLFAAAVLHAQSEPKEPISPLKPPHRILLQLDREDPSQMSAADSQVVASRQEQLNSAAATAGFNLQQSGWSYQQAVCPVLPTAVFLQYQAETGTSHASRFVAVVPRGTGDVQIVPVQRGGNSPFTSSSENGNTIAIFNSLVAQAGVNLYNPAMDEDDGWVKLALCYAELAGDHPTTLLTDTIYGESFERNVTMPKRTYNDRKGDFVLTFSDVNNPQSTVNWNLKFDKTAHLASVTVVPQKMNSPVRTEKPITDIWPEKAAR